MQRLFKQFSFPGGIPSHAAPETPGSIHEGGELGYSLAHAYGAAFDNPDLIVACVVGDGEAETGPLATAWHSNKFLNPVTRRRGAADPAPERLQDRQSRPSWRGSAARSWRASFPGYGYRPYLVEGSEPEAMHQAMAATMDAVLAEIRAIQANARAERRGHAPPLADDHPADAQGMDRAQGGGRQEDGGLLALAPGAAGRPANEAGACQACSSSG